MVDKAGLIDSLQMTAVEQLSQTRYFQGAVGDAFDVGDETTVQANYLWAGHRLFRCWMGSRR